jgi:predicted MFS family arabinose efflux permease
VLAAAVPAFGPMLLSRALVGVGGVLVAVSIPAVVTLSFRPESRGVPMGLVSCWVPVGFFVAFNGAPRVAAASDWQTAAWIAALILVAGALVYGVFVRVRASRSDEPETSGGWRDFAGHREIWLHAAAFCCFSSAMVAMFSFYPTFLVEQRGYDLGTASSMTSLVMVAGMPAGVLAGFVANRIGSYKAVYVPCLALTGVLIVLPFRLGGDLLIPLSLLAVGFVSSCFPAPATAAVPEIMGSPRLTGPGMAIITLGANAAVLTGPVLFGWLVDVAGWDAAAISLAPMLLLGALLAWRVKLR